MIGRSMRTHLFVVYIAWRTSNKEGRNQRGLWVGELSLSVNGFYCIVNDFSFTNKGVFKITID